MILVRVDPARNRPYTSVVPKTFDSITIVKQYARDALSELVDTGGGPGFSLSRPQIEAFAAGLYQLAACDGVNATEEALITEFLQDVGASDLASKLPDLVFDPASAYLLFETRWLRTLFLRSAVLVVRADGAVTEIERENLSWMSMAFGVTGGYEALVAELDGQAL
jgi:hypothetical protein